MIELKQADIFSLEVDAIVNAVNCVGIMGKGLALQFKKRYPDNFCEYRRACEQKQVVPGKMFVYTLKNVVLPKFIINFPTKRHWRDNSRIEDIKSGLMDLVQILQGGQIRSIAIPPLGCGLGGLDWNIVRPLIEQSLAGIPEVHAIVLEPGSLK